MTPHPTPRVALIRTHVTELCTQGMLQLDGQRHCWTLEDRVRERRLKGSRWEWQREYKVPGATAIPSGTYPLTITMSTRFGRPMPHIGEVPDFDGVRLHGGNTVDDTEGCPLLGLNRSRCYVWNCPPAMDALMAWLTAALASGPQLIEVRNPW